MDSVRKIIHIRHLTRYTHSCLGLVKGRQPEGPTDRQKLPSALSPVLCDATWLIIMYQTFGLHSQNGYHY